MTTVGYGDMTPYYEHGRALAVLVMFFGSLFTAMPLAIIGNEYESTWEQMTVQKRNEDARKAKMKLAKELSVVDKNVSKEMHESARQMHIMLNEGVAQANLDKVKATVTESNEIERDVDNSVTVGREKAKSGGILAEAMNGMKSSIAKLRLLTLNDSSETKILSKKLSFILSPRYLSPAHLDVLIQLREWISSVRIALQELRKIGGAGLINLSYYEDLEETLMISEKLAFELLSGENELLASIQKDREREAKMRAKAERKRAKEERKARNA